MPWRVSKTSKCPVSRPYGVIKSSTGEVVACHATNEKAVKQMRALYASEKK